MSQGCGCYSRKCSFNVLNGPEAEPEGRGQATPNTAPPCASRTTILHQVSTGHRMSTGSPQSNPIKTHSFLKAKMLPNPSRPFCHTAHTRAYLISCVGGVTPPHCNHIRFKPSSPPVWPYGPLDHTGVQCLINWHGLTFDLLPRPHKHLAGCKGHTESGTRPPIAATQPFAPMAKYWPVKPRPTGGNKTCINTHGDTAHRAGSTPTSLIRPN